MQAVLYPIKDAIHGMGELIELAPHYLANEYNDFYKERSRGIMYSVTDNGYRLYISLPNYVYECTRAGEL